MVECKGPTGHNVEYVLRLADWFRLSLPDVLDEHLFTLESHIRHVIKERKLCVKSMMREECEHAAAAAAAGGAEPAAVMEVDGAVGGAEPEGAAAAAEPEHRAGSFAHSSGLGRAGLRCLNV